MISARFAVARTPAVAPNEMVATSSALGTAAALETFRRGGNAVDAAVAADAALGVVQPMRSGLGGDLFALVEREGAVHAYNGSGPLPTAFAPPDGPMPTHGGATMTVPGLVEAWSALHARFGAVALDVCLEPAIRLARNGFPLGAEEAAEWITEARRLPPDAHRMFRPGGTAPSAGDVLDNPAQAELLEAIARGGDRAFYEGAPAEAVVRAAVPHGSAMTTDDLAARTAASGSSRSTQRATVSGS